MGTRPQIDLQGLAQLLWICIKLMQDFEEQTGQPMQLIRAYRMICLPRYGENQFQSNWNDSQSVQSKQSRTSKQIIEAIPKLSFGEER